MMVFNSLEQITPLPGPGSKYTVRALLFICVWKEVVQMTPPPDLPRIPAEVCVYVWWLS